MHFHTQCGLWCKFVGHRRQLCKSSLLGTHDNRSHNAPDLTGGPHSTHSFQVRRSWLCLLYMKIGHKSQLSRLGWWYRRCHKPHNVAYRYSNQHKSHCSWSGLVGYSFGCKSRHHRPVQMGTWCHKRHSCWDLLGCPHRRCHRLVQRLASHYRRGHKRSRSLRRWCRLRWVGICCHKCHSGWDRH